MGRGSSKSHKASYGSEFKKLYESGNIKFVEVTSGSVTAPQYTMTPGRIYATIGEKNQVKHITFYDEEGNRTKQIDIDAKPHIINGKKEKTHTHLGFNHGENGTRLLDADEQQMVNRVLTIWYNHTRGPVV